MSFSHMSSRLIGGGLLLLAVSGCSSSGLVTVTGEVRLDGEPVDSAAVMFFPKGTGRPAWAHTDDTGAFELTTYRNNDGAALGDYNVSVTKIVEETVKVNRRIDSAEAEIRSELQGSGRRREVWLVPQRYSNPKESGLAYVVEAGGENHMVIELTSS